MTTERIDISAEVEALCKKLGLGDKTYVASLFVTPDLVSATVLLRDTSGSTFIGTNGEIAQEELFFKVST